MFKSLTQKIIFRIVHFAALATFLGVFVFAVRMDEHNRPPDILRYPSEKALGKASVAGDVQSNTLSVQNFSSHELSKRLAETIADCLSLTKDNASVHVAEMRKYFTPAAYEQYRQFLAEADFNGMVLTQGMRSGVYSLKNPTELAKGVYGGVYKWVFEAPITISFIPEHSETYRDEETKPINRNYTLRLQLARVEDEQDPDSVKIELWQSLVSDGVQ